MLVSRREISLSQELLAAREALVATGRRLAAQTPTMFAYLGYSLNPFKGGYIGAYIGDYYRGY